jgi:hypothetical protein
MLHHLPSGNAHFITVRTLSVDALEWNSAAMQALPQCLSWSMERSFLEIHMTVSETCNEYVCTDVTCQ